MPIVRYWKAIVKLLIFKKKTFLFNIKKNKKWITYFIS